MYNIFFCFWCWSDGCRYFFSGRKCAL